MKLISFDTALADLVEPYLKGGGGGGGGEAKVVSFAYKLYYAAKL